MPGKKVLCGKCVKEIGKGGSVQCDKCTQWLHLRCAEISETFCSSMSKQDGVFFKCMECRSLVDNSGDLNQQIAQLHSKLDAISNQLNVQRIEVGKMIETSIDKLRAEFAAKFNEMESDIVTTKKQVKGLDSSLQNKSNKQ